MSLFGGNCRCCYSFKELEALCGPALDVYTLIYNTQGWKNEETPIPVCLRCCEFLKEVHHFRINRHELDETFRRNLDNKHFKVETTLGNRIDEINQIDVQINQVKVEFDYENSQQASNSFPEIAFNSNIRKTDNQLHNSFDFKDSNSSIESCDVKEFYLGREELQPDKIERRNPSTSMNDSNSWISKQLHKSYQKTCSIKTFLECDKCSFKCRRKQHMIAHEIFHSKKRLIIPIVRCDGTNQTGGNLNCFQVNEKNLLIDSRKLLKCSECSFQTIVLAKLKRHIASQHNDERPFGCDQCDYRANFKKYLIQHIRVVHMKNVPNHFACKECSFQGNSFYKLRSHISNAHRDEKCYRCDQCDYTASKHYNLYAHKKNHLNDSDKPYKCSECSFRTIYLSKLEIHTKRIHCEDTPFSCEQCDRCFKIKHDLSLHVRRVHMNKASESNETLECNECSYKTLIPSNLRRHIVSKHTDEKRFGCDQCSYRAKLKKSLNRHKIVAHLSDELINCSECSFKATSEYHLKWHIEKKHPNVLFSETINSVKSLEN